METTLATRHVFIDTSIFVQQKFQWHSGHLKRLESLANAGKIYIHLTSITVNEIEKKIFESLNEALRSLKNFRKEATILSNISEPSFMAVFSRIDRNAIYETLKSQFVEFNDNAKIDTIGINSVYIDDIFQRYFSQAPPFGDGEKKCEFPDAFAIAALEKWCDQNSKQIYIVSSDKDWMAASHASENLIGLTRIEEFLDLVSMYDENLSSFVIQLFEKNIEVINERIEHEFGLMGFWLKDQEGDVHDITLNQFEIAEKYLVEVDDNLASFELNAVFIFAADVEYDDYETAVYDSEDGVAIPWRSIKRTAKTFIEAPIEITFSFDSIDQEHFRIDSLTINNGEDIGVSVNEHHYYDLK